ncbi:MAG: DUF4388 domain-containing protein [Actinobacteria bacterium]|nr:DUF4388 domain-containing protein [Actinomycetota bacterium]
MTPSTASTAGPNVSARATTTLQGSIDSFPITDLLTLLSTARRSGRLVVRPAQPLWMHVREGKVLLCGAASPMALGRHLLAQGAVSARQLDEWFSLSELSATPAALAPLDVLGTLARLAEQDQLSAAALQEAVADSCVATAVEMLGLAPADANGDSVAFVFSEAEATTVGERYALDMDAVLDEATRQRAFLSEASQRLGGPETRFGRMSRIAAASAPVTLQAHEWAALAELDDRATVAQVSHRLGLGLARTYEALDRFMTLGLIEQTA